MRALGVATAVTGGVLASFPQQVGRRVSGTGEVPEQTIIQVLGGRYVLQGVTQCLWPTRRVLQLSSAADVLHAASMVPVALAMPRYRNASVVSLGLALTSAACAAALAANGR